MVVAIAVYGRRRHLCGGCARRVSVHGAVVGPGVLTLAARPRPCLPCDACYFQEWVEAVENPAAPWVVTYTSAGGDVVVVDYKAWVRTKPGEGEPYWWNDATKESQWQRPGT